jgi:hypothetical protein
LSNFSVQKKNEDDFDLFVMSIPEFEKYLERPGAWKTELLPKVSAAIFKTLKSVQETQTSDNKSRCFEVYGFDIMFDQLFNPWILEVNLSPACNERTPFLTKMLDDMSFDLINWLERRILVSSMQDPSALNDQLRQKRNIYLRNRDLYELHDNLNLTEFYEENQIDNRWVRLEESLEEVK